MIEANELRLGNIVRNKCASNKYFARVKKLTETRCFYGLFNSAYSDLVPIPLTPEILERCWFEQQGTRSHLWQLKFIQVLFHDNGVDVSYLQIAKNHIHSLHQLQNLYFALTGEELNITL